MLKRRTQTLTPFRVFFWLFAFLALVFVLMDRRPFVVSADDPQEGGSFQEELVEGDIVVIVDIAATKERTGRGEFVRPFAWVDALRQEYGPTSVVDVGTVNGEFLRNYRYVIVTESASSSSRMMEQRSALESFVTNGGILALELPQGVLRTAFSADGDGGWRSPSAITAVAGVDETTGADLMAMPLITRFIGSVRPVEGAKTHMAMDGAPVIYSKPVGKGRVITVDFALAAQLSAVQQGTPGNRMRVKPRRAGQPVRSTDLIAAPQLFGSSVPYADVLERFVVHTVLGYQEPLFFFWPYPHQGRGALLSSHQSRYVSGRPLWMSVHEREAKARTITFVASPDPQRPTTSFTEPEHVDHAALLWVVDPRDAGLQKAWGVLGLHPVIQPLTLDAQRRGLTRSFTGLRTEDIHGIRTWSGRWSENFVEPFRIMQAHGFRYDSSYGPVPGLPQGYLFGTCQPFRPVDAQGLPFSIHEVPVCFIDPSTDNDLQLVGRALRRASEAMDVVHVLTSADAFRDQPDMRAFDAWRDMLRYAEKNKMWIGGAGQFIEFRRVRQNSQLRVAGRTVERNDKSGDIRATRYVLEAEVPGGSFTLAIPLQADGKALHSIVRGVALTAGSGRDDIVFEDVDYGGQTFRLIPLASGFTTLTIRYGT